MRIGIDLVKVPYAQNTPTFDYSTVQGGAQAVNGGLAFIPDDWSKLKYSVGGDGIQPVNKQSYLSVQPDGTYQARASAGPWETFFANGAVLAVAPTGPVFTFAFMQIG